MMIVKLWVKKIIERKKTFQDVPEKLKEQVKEMLIQLNYQTFIPNKN